MATVAVLATGLFAAFTGIALAHENQVIRFGSFLGGFTHPVLGLDHFLAMVSVGIVSSMLGGRAIWTVPSLFVVMMAIGGAFGRADIGLGETAIETGIAVSVIALGLAIAADRKLPVRVVMGAVVFFGFFHGYAHGVEIPNIARPALYAGGFLLGTALIHLLGVLVGEMTKRYGRGRVALRVIGAVFVVIGVLFIAGVM
ncbi:MAG: HupE/UreJ family protein [Acidimicrobiia bacterium]|nr:HupE/UreJ family protein [Acidimicrobiia bacterium]